jgi:hypothetical protein
MKIVIAAIIRGTTVCHATTDEIPFPISYTPMERVVPHGSSFPLLRYDLLVEKDKAEFLAPTAKSGAIVRRGRRGPLVPLRP